jgi:predicted ATPase/DNA-binding XRE family transcriptional regulator
MSSDTETFADLLRHSRIARGLTQEDLAEQSGLSVRAISNLERGINRAPRKDTLELLANALGLPPDERRRWERIRRRGSVRAPSSAAASRDAVLSQLVTLPSPLTTLIGRDQELKEVRRLLESHRLVTLTGPGGIGKTRVAIAAAQHIAGRYAGGVVFVDLAPVRDPTLVLPAIAAELGARASGERSLADSLILALRGRCLLLILDNVEHVVQAAGEIGRLVRACPSLVVLATSRAPLRVSGEAEYLIKPLPLPHPAHETDVERLRGNPTVALFVERAQLVKSGFDLIPGNAEAIVSICQRLDGVPLAIELAAARLRSLSLQRVRERLERPLELLTGGARDLPDRQRTMRDTIQWSYDLLSPAEQALLRRVSVFAGGWTLDAAQAVVDPDGIRGTEILDGLASLVEQGLVIQHERADETVRYRLLEPIREFGVEQLEQVEDAGSVRSSHAQAFLQLTKDAEPFLLSGSRESWLDRLDKEHANLRSAIRWLLRVDPAAALDLAGSLGWFWYLRGYFSEGRRMLIEALTAETSTEPSHARATALTSLARLAFYQESYEQAATYADSGLAMWRELEDKQGLAHAHIVAGLTYLQLGKPCAVNHLQDARRLFDVLGDRWGLAQALLYLGVADVLGSSSHHGPLNEARRQLSQAAVIYRELDDRWQLGIVLSYLALIAERDGNTVMALDLHRESHALALTSGDKWRFRITGNRLGSLLHRTGDFAGAARAFSDALRVSRDLGVPEFLAFEQELLGRALVDWGKADEAIPYLEDALRTYRELDEQDDIAVILHNLADAYALQGETREAMSMYREGLMTAAAINHTVTIVDCLDGVARLLARGHETELAARMMSAASACRSAHDLEAPLLYRRSSAREMDHLRSTLGLTHFERAWRDGQAMTLNDAIACVRDLEDDQLEAS